MAAEGRGERATISDMPAALTVAVAQPRCVACDAATNAREHARAVREARARVVVFPELSLTGYELDAEAVAPDDDALAAIVDACVAVEALALVGAPVADGDGREYIATLRVSRDGVDVAYRKTWLGGDERTRFCAGPGPAAIDVDGWRVGLGICKDTSVTDHIDATAALGIDLYVAGLAHLPEELREQERRALRIAARTRAHVAFASFAGSTGGGFDRTAGRSGIWSPTGAALAQAGTAPGAIAVETIDWIAAA